MILLNKVIAIESEFKYPNHVMGIGIETARELLRLVAPQSMY
jgi:hypothetical protein